MSPHTDAGELRAVNSFISPEHTRDDLIVMIQQRDLLVSDLKSVVESLRQAASHGSAGGERSNLSGTDFLPLEEVRAIEAALPKLTAAGTSLQNLQTSPTEQEYLADNIATVAWHLGRPGARMRVDNDMCGLAVDPGEVLKEVSRRLTAPAQASPKPMAYWVEHPKFGMELSLDPPNEDAIERGWKATPLYSLSSADRS